MFPEIKRRVAVRAPEFSWLSNTAMKVKKKITDFAFDLRAFFTVVEVKILCWSRTVGTFGVFGDFGFRFFRINRLKRLVMFF